MELILKVIRDKRDRFALKTLVQVIWACARIDFTKDLNEQKIWKGDGFNELMEALKTKLPDDIVCEVENKIPISVRNSKACNLS